MPSPPYPQSAALRNWSATASIRVARLPVSRIAAAMSPVSLTAAHRPEQLRLAVGSDLPQLPVSADDVDAAYPVGGEAVAAAERPDPAAEGIADDTDVRAGPAERGEAVRHGVRQHLAP